MTFRSFPQNCFLESRAQELGRYVIYHITRYLSKAAGACFFVLSKSVRTEQIISGYMQHCPCYHLLFIRNSLDVGWLCSYNLIKDTCYGLGKNSQNQQPLDILACNSANRPSFNKWTHIFLSDFEKMVSFLNYRPECPEVADFCYPLSPKKHNILEVAFLLEKNVYQWIPWSRVTWPWPWAPGKIHEEKLCFFWDWVYFSLTHSKCFDPGV